MEDIPPAGAIRYRTEDTEIWIWDTARATTDGEAATSIRTTRPAESSKDNVTTTSCFRRGPGQDSAGQASTRMMNDGTGDLFLGRPRKGIPIIPSSSP